MSEDNNSMLEDFLHCMKALHYMRVRNLEEKYEKREEYIRLTHESQKVYEELEASLDEKQKALLMRFSDLTGEMEMKRGFFFYMHGFEDCQVMNDLFRNFANGVLHIPLLEDYEALKDNSPDDSILIKECSVSSLEKKIRELRKALDSFVDPANLCDNNIFAKSRELDGLLLKYYKKSKRLTSPE